MESIQEDVMEESERFINKIAELIIEVLIL